MFKFQKRHNNNQGVSLFVQKLRSVSPILISLLYFTQTFEKGKLTFRDISLHCYYSCYYYCQYIGLSVCKSGNMEQNKPDINLCIKFIDNTWSDLCNVT